MGLPDFGVGCRLEGHEERPVSDIEAPPWDLGNAINLQGSLGALLPVNQTPTDLLMEKIPVELWMYICSLACTDGGRTGRSLSLVCRSLHEYSKPFKYQCIALKTPRQIRRLADTLENPFYKCGSVQSLYIHCPDLSLDYNDEDDSDYIYVSPGVARSVGSAHSTGGESEDLMDTDSAGDEFEDRPLSHEEEEELVQELADIRMQPADSDDGISSAHVNAQSSDSGRPSLLDQSTKKKDDEALDDLFHLLGIVAPTLVTFSVHWTSLEPFLIEETIPPLPKLQELCLFRSFTGDDEADPETDDPAPTLFPSLQRLHFAGYVETRPTTYGKMLADLAPALTELRCNIYEFELKESDAYRLSTSVQRVVLEISKLSSGIEEMQRSKGVYSSLLFGPNASSRSVEFCCLDYPYDAAEWESQWLSRVAGGMGCWSSV